MSMGQKRCDVVVGHENRFVSWVRGGKHGDAPHRLGWLVDVQGFAR